MPQAAERETEFPEPLNVHSPVRCSAHGLRR
jgi:hypothetical protein